LPEGFDLKDLIEKQDISQQNNKSIRKRYALAG